MKRCEFCDEEFEPKPKAMHATRFCSRQCQVRAYRDTLYLRRPR